MIKQLIGDNAPAFGNLESHFGTFECSEFNIALMRLQQLGQSAPGHCAEGHGFNSHWENP